MCVCTMYVYACAAVYGGGGEEGAGQAEQCMDSDSKLCFFCCVIEVSQYAVRSLGGMFLTVRHCAQTMCLNKSVEAYKSIDV